jgi:hypothetical protein
MTADISGAISLELIAAGVRVVVYRQSVNTRAATFHEPRVGSKLLGSKRSMTSPSVSPT